MPQVKKSREENAAEKITKVEQKKRKDKLKKHHKAKSEQIDSATIETEGEFIAVVIQLFESSKEKYLSASVGE